MQDRNIETAVLGSGPAGLAAAYVLGKAGRRAVVIERGREAGGLMRSIQHGAYCVDVGRKELYSRLPDVHALWSEVLGADYRPYPHRIGVLYQGHVIERSRAFRGFRRGMPWPLLVRGTADLMATHLVNPFRPPPQNEEEFWYRARGRVFSIALSQGYKEKFSGRSWSASRPPPAAANGGALGLYRTALKGIVGRAIARDHGRAEWRHPAKGSGQITARLKEVLDHFNSEDYRSANRKINAIARDLQ